MMHTLTILQETQILVYLDILPTLVILSSSCMKMELKEILIILLRLGMMVSIDRFPSVAIKCNVPNSSFFNGMMALRIRLGGLLVGLEISKRKLIFLLLLLSLLLF